jgi:hypothetical protein
MTKVRPSDTYVECQGCGESYPKGSSHTCLDL